MQTIHGIYNTKHSRFVIVLLAVNINLQEKSISIFTYIQTDIFVYANQRLLNRFTHLNVVPAPICHV